MGYHLGVTSPVSANQAAALVKDGKLLAAVEEERFNRVKHSVGFDTPIESIRYCLNYAGISLNEVDKISVGFGSPSDNLKYELRYFLKRPTQALYLNRIRWFSDTVNKNKFLKENKRKVKFYNHHLSHASSAFHVSGFSKANILTIDGKGETQSTVLSVGKENAEIKVLKSYELLNSLGHLYAVFTDYLGFKKGSHEGKVMGLASYGKPIYDTTDIIKFTKNGYSLETMSRYLSGLTGLAKLYNDRELKTVDRVLIKKFGPKRNKEDKILQRHANIAATIQNIYEKALLKVAEDLHDMTGLKTFGLAGGCALNCVGNGVLLEQDYVNDIYVQPASNDAGAAIGAAFLGYGRKTNFVMDHAYWGPEYDNDEIKKALDKAKLKYDYYKDIESKTAELVAKKKIVGWFQGRVEIGPRALGNRSIVCDPRELAMKDKVNIQVKHRECYDKKTEILTKDGWKLFKDLKGNEEVATLNPKTNELEYQRIQRKVKYKYDGQMVHFKNKRINLMVTPNHKIWAKKITNHQKGHSHTKKFEFEEASNLLKKEHIQVKSISKWRGKEKKYFRLPKIKKKKYSHLSQITKISMDLWLEFLGYYISEGSFCYNNGHHGVFLSQSKKSKHFKKIEKCLNKMPYKWNYNNKSFRTSNKQLYHYLKQLGKAKNKFIPQEFLHLPQRQLRILFNALICGDGTIRDKQYKYFTISERLVNNIQELGLKLGYSINTVKEIRKNNPRRNTFGRFDLYSLRINGGSKISWVKGNQSSLKKYNGYVYCVTVPKYHILCVKREGKIIFSGNSWRPFAPSILDRAAKEYFENAYNSPFMILNFRVKMDRWKEIPAVVHVDGTARAQTVSKKTNPRYYKLIEEFEKITGVPVVLNTSFNDREEPLVNKPEEAIRFFKSSGFDALAIGNYLVKK